MTTQEEIKQIAHKLYGIDLKGYSASFLNRRIELICSRNGLKNNAELRNALINQPGFIHELTAELNVNTTELFRDPESFHSIIQLIGERIQPNQPFRIWHAGCSSGEEVYSLAILLKENNWLDQCRIYATDISSKVLNKAKYFHFSTEKFAETNKRYSAAGGKKSLMDHVRICYDKMLPDPGLKKNVVFGFHRLGQSKVFHEFDLILCRNVFIYYDFAHQSTMLKSLSDSLVPGGLLCMGMNESIGIPDVDGEFTCVNKSQFIYQKK